MEHRAPQDSARSFRRGNPGAEGSARGRVLRNLPDGRSGIFHQSHEGALPGSRRFFGPKISPLERGSRDGGAAVFLPGGRGKIPAARGRCVEGQAPLRHRREGRGRLGRQTPGDGKAAQKERLVAGPAGHDCAGLRLGRHFSRDVLFRENGDRARQAEAGDPTAPNRQRPARKARPPASGSARARPGRGARPAGPGPGGTRRAAEESRSQNGDATGRAQTGGSAGRFPARSAGPGPCGSAPPTDRSTRAGTAAYRSSRAGAARCPAGHSREPRRHPEKRAQAD